MLKPTLCYKQHREGNESKENRKEKKENENCTILVSCPQKAMNFNCQSPTKKSGKRNLFIHYINKY